MTGLLITAAADLGIVSRGERIQYMNRRTLPVSAVITSAFAVDIESGGDWRERRGNYKVFESADTQVQSSSGEAVRNELL